MKLIVEEITHILDELRDLIQKIETMSQSEPDLKSRLLNCQISLMSLYTQLNEKLEALDKKKLTGGPH